MAYKSHMAVYAVIGELIGHNSASGIIEQDIDAIGVICDLLRYCRNGFPVCEIAVDPLGAICFVLSQLLCYGLQSSIYDFLREREDVELLDVIVQQGIGEAIADA